ncbi:putative ABC transport system substrate-binding protein [Pseudobutyrivibrio sp. YE44]|uniref:ABC transporter substrate-binding protein n=1 Tax=Pseudobutyrivibrio sp. YE44 TaxID=1520802 RepID=UPI00088E735A|nr:ABC transporter substrate binding protein [Pseudobutyrivibrio sp. YE44]SDB38193.1 putative ABC transport system substrate-binding protein [Pseudobutyrivibrio sp. YE44]
MKKRFLSLILVASLAVSAVACSNKSDSKPKPNEVTEESQEDSYSYNISALLTENNTYNKILLQGFTDCLTDYLGEDHFKITTSVASDKLSSDQIAAGAVAKSPDMIFTAGKSTLVSAKSATDMIPIVATGIVDFKGTLRIASLNGKSWDKTTGTNVTGVSSKPSIVDQVSLMIEATEDLQTVGILFSPEDTDAIYQNEIFEAYLDQAGIPWKEYLIPATKPTVAVDSEEQSSTALTPSKYVASSAKQGMDNDITPLGEDSVLGLNSTSSTRVALVSQFWTGGKIVAEASGEEKSSDNEDGNSEDSATSTDKKIESDTAPKTGTEASDDELNNAENIDSINLADRIRETCAECSAIYIPFGSMLTNEMDTIGTIAEDAGVTVVAGDTTIGKHSLVTLFSDPYTLGYAAGKKAVKVFEGEDIQTIKIGSVDGDDSVKLYNGVIADKFGMEFPKSFKELNDFLDTYEYGSTTTRYTASGE